MASITVAMIGGTGGQGMPLVEGIVDPLSYLLQ